LPKFIQIVNGVPRMVEVNTTIYDEVYNAPSNISAGTPITLPNSGVYASTELRISFNGNILQLTEDFLYVGAGPSRTQVSLTFDIFTGEKIRFYKERDF
jgi:hypothetical protein